MGLFGLVENNIITSAIGKELDNERQLKNNDLPNILRGYIYASGGLRTKIEKPKDNKTCIIF